MANLTHTYGGTYITRGAYLFAASAPLDTRSVVQTILHLISEYTWYNDGTYVAFNGLQVYVEDTHEMYLLTDASGLKANLKPNEYFQGELDPVTNTRIPPTDAEVQRIVDLYWTKLALSSSLSSLSGVFQFKGVAYNISDDLSVLTCGKAYVATNLGGPELYKYIVCKSTAYDMAGELYYSWADEDGNILFWTDSTVLNSNASLYDRNERSFSLYYVTDGLGEKYYLNTNTPMTTGDDTEGIDWGKCLLFWHEDCKDSADYANIKAIYCPGGLEALKDGDTFQTVNGATYTYNEETVTVHIIESVYTFTTKTHPYDIYTSDNGSDKPILDGMTSVYTVLAAPENAGHVYQILENEYASNGSIWVKLGTPLEDWIIL